MALDPLAYIAAYESGTPGQIGSYNATATNPNSSAQGAYQILQGTWQQWAPNAGVSLQQYPTAGSAPLSVQNQVASYGYNTQGFTPWASNQGLMSAIFGAGGTSAFTDPSSSSGQTGNFSIDVANAGNPSAGVAAGGATGATIAPGAAGTLSPLSTILTAISSFFQRAGLGIFGVVLIAIGAWAIVKNRDVAAPIAARVKRAVS
jgi:hypothetical protein